MISRPSEVLSSVDRMSSNLLLQRLNLGRHGACGASPAPPQPTAEQHVLRISKVLCIAHPPR